MSVSGSHSDAAPTDSDFVLGRGSFASGQAGSYKIEFTQEVGDDRLQSWPMVYILSNDSDAYVGQTTSVDRRMGQHAANPEKQGFTNLTVIYNETFNASVVTDYEHRLIDLMQGDGHFCLTNRNSGQTPTNYYSKEAYDEMFGKLWEELRDIEMADNAIADVEQSEAFKFSPFKALTPDQEVAIQEIVGVVHDALASGDASSCHPVVVQGMPGTGKTVLAIALLKLLNDLAYEDGSEHAAFHGARIRLLEPVTGLRKTIQRALKKTVNISPDDIIGPNDLAKVDWSTVGGGKPFDVVLVDEAHNLRTRKNMPPLQYKYYDRVTDSLGLEHGAPQIDWVLNQVRVPVFFYDPLQTIGPKCVGDSLLRERIGDAIDRPIELTSEMRVKGGADYLKYVQSLLFDQEVMPRKFDGYPFVLHASFAEFVSSFERDLEASNLTRMIAGYAWEWKSKTDKTVFDIKIDGIAKRWNRTYMDWVGKGLTNEDTVREVGCIHSTQGYDLTNAYVIVGNDLRFDTRLQRIVVNRDSYFDSGGKRTASDEELDRYIRNIYYVLLTRGINSTHVYVCDEALREHLGRNMRVVGDSTSPGSC